MKKIRKSISTKRNIIMRNTKMMRLIADVR